MIFGTVALPIWNSNKIAWLCLESLCRQHKPENGWELVVFEEMHLTAVGEPYIRSYEERLRDVGCEKVTYLTDTERLPLSYKWILIAQAASVSSKYYCMCAADNYYNPWLLRDSETAIEKADWCIQVKGYFYDFTLDKVVMYNYPALIGLQMTANTNMVRTFNFEPRSRGVDGWFTYQMQMASIKKRGRQGQLPCFIFGSDHWEKTCCTNGLNNISTGRVNWFKDIKKPFYETDKKLEEIVPEDIYIRMMDITKYFDGLDKFKEEEAGLLADNKEKDVPGNLPG